MVFGVAGELLTSTESIVQPWKEYFEDIFNPLNMHSEGAAEPENFGLGSLITGDELTWTVKGQRQRLRVG